MVADGDVSLSPSVNELLVTVLPPGLPHMNKLSVKLLEPTQFIYSILHFLLKLSTTDRKLQATTICIHMITLLCFTLRPMYLYSVYSVGETIHTHLIIKPMHV